MVSSRTSPSPARLSEAARHVVIPDGIVTTGWPAVQAKAAELGIEYDPWQQGAGRVALGKRADGKYAATVGGIALSIPRQVGKTFWVGSMLVVLCVLFPGMKVLWTAHRTRTATNTFQSMQGMTKRKKIAPHMLDPRTANGEQEIRFRNGSRIMFGAREQGFGRGFDEVDVEVFDEAQILTEKALDDMVPATNQARHPHGALLFFIGTPPRPVDPGEAFTGRRARALEGKTRDAVYIEFSADPDADPDDEAQWRKANPSYPHRTPLESMQRMRENLGSDDAWMREALGVWDAIGDAQVIPATAWREAADVASVAVDRLALGIDVAPDRSMASVSLAGAREDGRWHVELDEQRHGVGWLLDWVVRRCERNDIRAVAIDAISPAAGLVEELEQRGVRVTLLQTRQYAQACGAFYDGVIEAQLVHTDQPQVNVALAGASKRPLGDSWAWNRRQATSDITPVVSGTLALWGARAAKVTKPRRGSTVPQRVR